MQSEGLSKFRAAWRGPSGDKVRSDQTPGRALLSAAAAVLLAGCVSPPVFQNPTSATAAAEVVDRGWHTDIALSADAMTGRLAALRTWFPGVRYLVFGFGDRNFYMSRKETIGGTIAALFPDRGVILVTALSAPPANAFGTANVATIRVSPRQLAAIAGFIQASLASRLDGSIEPLAEGPYPGSLFLASSKTYDAFDDCNHWTLAVLKAGGLPVRPAGVIFAGQVVEQTQRIVALQRYPD